MALLRCILLFAGHVDWMLSLRFCDTNCVCLVCFLVFFFGLGFGEELGSLAQTEEVDLVEV